MRPRRRNRGFGQAADLGLGEMGLPRKRAREIVLAHAWENVAGGPIARNGRVLGLWRGVLEIEVDSGSWETALADLLPRLAAELAQRYPDLGVRKLRVRREGDRSRPPATDLPETEAAFEPRPAKRRAAPVLKESADAELPHGERLERLRERYLENAARRGCQGAQKP